LVRAIGNGFMPQLIGEIGVIPDLRPHGNNQGRNVLVYRI
jgi:hypothetical protein